MQELCETRDAMAEGLMKKIEEIINDTKRDKYYILVHAKPYPGHQNIIKQKIVITDKKPPMMLSCLLFGVDNIEGKLTLEWALPGDWPTWSCEGRNVPVAETIASYEKLDREVKLRYTGDLLAS